MMYLRSKMSGSQPLLLFDESSSFTTAVVLLLLQFLFDLFPVIDVNDNIVNMTIATRKMVV